MNCFLKNSRSVLSHLLRRRGPQGLADSSSRPASLLSPRTTHRRYGHSGPQRRETTRWSSRRGGGSRWYEDEWVRAAGFLVVGTGAVAVFFCRAETVPYTNRTRLILLSPNAERRLGKFIFEEEKRNLESKILSPLHPQSVRVRRIASEIIRGVHRGLLASCQRLDASDGNGGTSTDLTIKNRDAEGGGVVVHAGRGGSPRGNVVSAAAAGQRDDYEGQNRRRPWWGAHVNLDGLNWEWEVIVVKDDMVNAMCAPGGKIIVYTGLLDKFREDAEIATILGHEVGHAVARHSAEAITVFFWFLVLDLSILQFVNMPDELVDAVWKYFLELPFSRRMEMEADYLGLMLLAAAGYDPRVAPSVYEKLGEIGGDSELHNYISTHPSCKKRSQLLSQEHVMGEALELYRQVSTGQDTSVWGRFRTVILNILGLK